ncbi:MAG: hypothetical protein Q9M40_07060 [Sulfurimonas sp.]|nr:hypothetical protein [Sulfurimonas sp.]MDQ7067733.1 hypothetical protein [Sulfurimonas sp.]
MKASDFILHTKADLQDKSSQWSDELLLVKLQGAYVSMQFDLPYFITRENIAITEGNDTYRLRFKMLKNVSLKINETPVPFIEIESFYTQAQAFGYAVNEYELLFNEIPKAIADAKITYRYEKTLENANCEIELPSEYHEALRLLLKARIYEKPTLNSKQRNLSTYYLNLYAIEIKKLKLNKSIRQKNIHSKYQRI